MGYCTRIKCLFSLSLVLLMGIPAAFAGIGTPTTRPDALNVALDGLYIPTPALHFELPLVLLGGFDIDGNIPDAGTTQYPDPYGSVQELGPENGSPQQLEVINRAIPPMLSATDVPGKTDFVNVWMKTNLVDEGLPTEKYFQYMAFQRQETSGSGVIMFEFQHEALTAACDYSGTEAALIAGCNPFANRIAGDFILIFDQQGQDIAISYRIFIQDPAFPADPKRLILDDPVPLPAGTYEATMNEAEDMGEAVVDMYAAGLFSPDDCLLIANIIPGTMTGNSDTADYKDIVLLNLTPIYTCQLDIEKTVVPSYTRTYEWDIDKKVTPETWDLFLGDSGTSDYTVTVDQTGFTDSDFSVTGTITITNANSEAATITGVTDELAGDVTATVSCPVTFPYVLASQGTLTCSYLVSPTSADATTNTATVACSGNVLGNSTTEDVVFGDPTTEVNETVSITDTYSGDLGTTDVDATYQYSRTFTCDADEGTHDNTASIVETGQSDDASVDVNCYELTVTKDASTSLSRVWAWEINKVLDATSGLDSLAEDTWEALIAADTPVELWALYHAAVTATYVDSNWDVKGNIQIDNPAPMDATLTSVADVVSPAIAATVDCPALTVPAGGSLACTYTADLPDAADRTNTATASLQNYAYDSGGTGTENGTTDFSGTANVDFSNATIIETNECVDVSDTKFGALSDPDPFCATPGNQSFTFDYSMDLIAEVFADGTIERCQTTGINTYEFPNTACYVSTDDGTVTGCDDVLATLTVECEEGCTLTQGYWKTHSAYKWGDNIKHIDPTWAMLGDQTDIDTDNEGETEDFFLSGMSWIAVMYQNASNYYFQLARQYVAAKLNDIASATFPPATQTAFNSATTFFESCTPATFASGSCGKPGGGKYKKSDLIPLQNALAMFNEGLAGVGHCVENSLMQVLPTQPIVAVKQEQVIETTQETAEEQVITASEEVLQPVIELPTEYGVEAYPNPFYPETTIRLQLPEAAEVNLAVYDMTGRLVARLVDGSLSAGIHEVRWNASNLPSGMYIYLVRTEKFTASKKVVLIK